MGDTYGRLISFIVAIMFMVLVPSMAILQYSDKIMHSYAETTIEQFVDTCRETGYVSEQAYQRLISALNDTGYTFEIQISCEKKTSYPVEGNELFNTNYLAEDEADIMDAALETIDMEHLNQGGKYYMRDGDYLSVSIISLKDTTASVMARTLTMGLMQGKKITANYGGFVGTDGYVTK